MIILDNEILGYLKELNEKIDRLEKSTCAPKNAQKRKCDPLGRITLPVSIRRELEIEDGTEVSLWVENGNIIISKAE